MTRPLRLTLIDAAHLARTSAENVRAALDSGDLRSLERRHVEAWTRGRNAAAVLRQARP
jgi:hypothetical protein